MTKENKPRIGGDHAGSELDVDGTMTHYDVNGRVYAMELPVIDISPGTNGRTKEDIRDEVTKAMVSSIFERPDASLPSLTKSYRWLHSSRPLDYDGRRFTTARPADVGLVVDPADMDRLLDDGKMVDIFSEHYGDRVDTKEIVTAIRDLVPGDIWLFEDTLIGEEDTPLVVFGNEKLLIFIHQEDTDDTFRYFNGTI